MAVVVFLDNRPGRKGGSMGIMLKILAVAVFFLETAGLCIAEKKLWKTLITPFNCLAVPYALVVLFCLLYGCRSDVYPFCYATLWVYSAGLVLFFLPSLGWALFFKKKYPPQKESIQPCFEFSAPFLRFWEYVTWAACAALSVRVVYLIFTSPYRFGSEGFGEAFANHGFFAHLHLLYVALTVLWATLFDFKQNKRYGLHIVFFLIFGLIIQTKSWILIPLVAAVLLRLLLGRMRLNWKVVLGILAGGFVLFCSVYWTNLYIFGRKAGQERHQVGHREYFMATVRYVPQHFVTYSVAGVYGFSQDMALGIEEERDPSKIYTSFYNIANVLRGKPTISQVNSCWIGFEKGETPVNVRGMMGSLYIFLGPWHAAAYMLTASVLIYLLFGCALRQRKLPVLLLLSAWGSGCLFFGWFEFYMQDLATIEVPLYMVMAACLWRLYQRSLKHERHN